MKAKICLCFVFLAAVLLCFLCCSKRDGSIFTTTKPQAETDAMNEIAATAANSGEEINDTASVKENSVDGAVKDNKKTSGNGRTEEKNEKPSDEYEIAFSETGYFYSGDIRLEIKSTKPCSIFYTTDGKDPDENQIYYEGPIELSAGNELSVSCIKAKAYFEGGHESKIIVHTYFLSKNINKRFDTLVFSVTTDPYNLYDYEYGIFVTGKLRDDYISENPNDTIEPNDPANYNMRGKDSERKVYLEIFEPDGTKIAGQNAGIRTYGGWSRDMAQKPIKIFTRDEYDEENDKLHYEFFPSKTAASGNGTILDTFNRLVLRNCGNDNGFAFIRDELFETLAGQAGYSDYEAVRPAALFVNGDYRGFFWLHEVYGKEYFKENYGEYSGDFKILEGGELYKKPDEDNGNEQAIEEYDSIYNTYSAMDLTDDNNYNELCRLIDVENYLSYYALQIYIGNEDWPNNNYKTYRYYASEGEEYREAPFDGKWRFMPHDLDYSFGIYGSRPTDVVLWNYVGRNGEIVDECPLFGQLMKRADCQEIFIKKTLDLLNGSFSPDNISTVLDEMNALRLNELKNTYGKDLLEDWVTYDQLNERLMQLKSYGEQRAGQVLQKYGQYFGLDDIYQLKVQPARGCEVKINTFRTRDYFEGSYYSDYATTISTTVPAGTEFDYWLVNGQKVCGEEISITSQNILNGKVIVSCVFKETVQSPCLVVSEISAAAEEDYIVLYNPNPEAVSTEDYFISDTLQKPLKTKLPVRTVEAGQSIRLLCKNNTEALNENDVKLDFSLKTGETVILYTKGKFIDAIPIPDLENENVYCRDMNTMRFYEEGNTGKKN